MCAATGHVRFTPNSDRESGHAANGHVCFTPDSGHVQCTSSCLLWAKSGHSYYRETEWDRQPRPNRGIKLLTAAGCDLTATRAAALDLQQADELARVFSKSNTKRPTGSADLVGCPILHDPHGNVWTSRAFKSAPVVTRLVRLDTCKPHL